MEPQERDALAARMFPQRWAAVANQTGERARRTRHNLRRQAETKQELDRLRDAGASCASCTSFARHPDHGRICEAGSDFHGYQLAKAEGLCTLWTARKG